jgi:hypothetical protein
MSKLGRDFTETQLKTQLRKRELAPFDNPKDEAVWRAIMNGKAYGVAMANSGYKYHQVAYRCKAWNMRTSDYRNDIITDYTKMVLRLQKRPEYRKQATRGMKQHLRTLFKSRQAGKNNETG